LNWLESKQPLEFPASVTAGNRLAIAILAAVVFHGLALLLIRVDLAKPRKVDSSLEIALVDTFVAESLPAARPDDHSDSRVPESQPRAKSQPDKKMEHPKRVVGLQSASKNPIGHRTLDPAVLLDQIDNLYSSVGESAETLARTERIKHIDSVKIHPYQAAAYESAFKIKVERIGKLNYPEQARREHLSGTLLLAVAVRKDGSIYRIEIRRSSGHKILDEGAVRIVQLAAPFAHFPPDLEKETDIVVITRVWKFSDDSSMTAVR
jgi:protein TonB